jgi:hypoxanthine phosphoribosyltransferase
MSSLRYLTWPEFDDICRGLARRLDDTRFDLIVGIARGGLPGAVYLAHLLGEPPFGTIHACKTTSNAAFAMTAEDEVVVRGTMLPPELAPRRALVVEDIVAIGDVFTRCDAILRERYGERLEIVHASLFADIDQIAGGPHAELLESLFYGERVDNKHVWIVPPWDEKALAGAAPHVSA